MSLKQGSEFPSPNVSGAYEQQFPRFAMKHMGMIKVSVFGHHDALFTKRKQINGLVGRAILRRQLAGMDGIMPCRLQDCA